MRVLPLTAEHAHTEHGSIGLTVGRLVTSARACAPSVGTGREGWRGSDPGKLPAYLSELTRH